MAGQTPTFLKPFDLEAAMKDGLPAKLVRELPVTDLYFALRDTADDTRRETLALVTPEQMQGIFDLDAWHGDRLNVLAVREWFVELEQSVPESRLAVHLSALDPELLVALVVTEFIVVPVGPDYEADAPAGEADWQSPDAKFWVWRKKAAAGTEAEPALKAMDILYRSDPDLAYRLLLQAATGLGSEMEEAAFHFREARLQDLGFPDFDTANGVWQARKTASALEVAGEEGPAGRHLAIEVARRGRFQEKLAALPAEAQARATGQLVFLANAVLISEAVPMRDLESVNRTLGMVAGFLDLGLTLPGAEPLIGSNVVGLFQLGVGVVAPLSQRARELLRTHAFDRWGRPLTLLEPGQAVFLESLARAHPLYSDPRAPEGRPVGFTSLEQVALARRTIDMLTAAAAFLFGETGLAEKSRGWEVSDGVFPPQEERTVRTLFGTFLARIVLKLEPSVEPVTREDMRKLLANVDKLAGFQEALAGLAATSSALGELIRLEAEPWVESLRAAAGKAELVDTILHYRVS
jgi:hypothetical protein